MRRSALLAFACLFALGGAGGLLVPALAAGPALSASGDAGADEVVARVGGTPIGLADIALADEDMGQTLASLPEDVRFQYLLGMLIDRRILALAAREKEIEDDPEVKRREAYFSEKVLRDVYWVQLMRDKIDEKAVRTYYDAHIANAEAETEFNARHILVGSKEEAEKLFAEIGGGKAFEEAAKASSRDSSSQDGGDLGWFTKADMVPEIFDAASKLKPGEVSGPVKSQFGWHLIKLVETRKAKKPSFEEAHDDVMRQLAREEGTKLMEELRKKAKIEIVGADTARPQIAPEAPAGAQ